MNHKHVFKQVISGPMLTVHKCQKCGLEITDVIDRGPNRIEIDREGNVWLVKSQNGE